MSRPGYPYQRALWAFNGVLFLPASGATLGTGLGGLWTTDHGTVSHPAPASTNTATQQKRTAIAQVVTTANQGLGPRLAQPEDAQFIYGTAVGRGGFYFSAIFTIEAWAGNTGRLFVGLSAAASGSIAALVDLAGVTANAKDCLGLYHDSADGANVLSLLNRAGGAATKAALGGPGSISLAAGSAFHWEMWCGPGTSTVQYRLSSFGSTSTTAIKYGTGGTATTFMAPQCQMSNGATDVTAGHFALGVANIYVEPDLAP